MLGAKLCLVLGSKLFEGVFEGPMDGKPLILVLMDMDGEDVGDADDELFGSLLGLFE